MAANDNAASCCAIIPARGGSKGIPRKNLIELAGKPLLVHCIDAARAARTIDSVFVSTDDDEIADTAAAAGAGVIRRPADLSGDMASSEDGLLHALDAIRDRSGDYPGYLAFLQCTSPLTAAEDIDGTVQQVMSNGFDSAFAATMFHYFIWRLDSGGHGVGINHDSAARPLRQEREPEYLEAGAVYAMRVDGFRTAKHRFFGKIGIYEMPASRCFEIDDMDDLRVAEALLGQGQSVLRNYLADRPKPELVCFDFDGVFTDNLVTVTEDGREAVVCNRSDGMGLAALKQTGVPVCVLSTEKNPVVTARCAKLGLECIQGLGDKLKALQEVASAHSADLRNTVYVGNDCNDVTCMEAVGCGVAVADSHTSALSVANVVLKSRGGAGAVREVCDALVDLLGE